MCEFLFTLSLANSFSIFKSQLYKFTSGVHINISFCTFMHKKKNHYQKMHNTSMWIFRPWIKFSIALFWIFSELMGTVNTYMIL